MNTRINRTKIDWSKICTNIIIYIIYNITNNYLTMGSFIQITGSKPAVNRSIYIYFAGGNFICHRVLYLEISLVQSIEFQQD